MGIRIDSIPVVSQVKSLVQAIQGDTEGARRTQENFLDDQISRIKTMLTPGGIWDACQGRRPISTELTPRPRWMASPGVQALYLHELLLPGTHDSATYRVENYRPGASVFVRAQELDIRKQLDGGIRYLDIRVDRSGDKLWCSHSAICVPYDDVLDAVKSFVEQNPTEKVIINLDWDTRSAQDLVDAKARADKVLGDYAVSAGALALPLAFWHSYQRILLLVRGSLEGIDIVSNSWDETKSPTPEAAVQNCAHWGRQRARTPYRLNLAACQATPAGSAQGVIEIVARAGLGLRSMAEVANYAIAAALLVDRQAVRGINIINMDFADDELIDLIVKLNPSDLAAAGYATVEENESRTLEGMNFLAFGTGNHLNYTMFADQSGRGQVSFSTDSFGDPQPGAAKKGYYRQAIVPRHDGWRRCRKCMTLFHAGQGQTGGKCTDGAPHDGDGSQFVLAHDVFLSPRSITGWHLCTECRVLTLSNDGCPARPDTKHVVAGRKYTVRYDVPADDKSQANWHMCAKCYALVYTGSGQGGSCPKGGNHDGPGSNFVLSLG